MPASNQARGQGARGRSGAAAQAAGAANIQAASPVGEVRRSQVITTYGIGAIVDLEDGSFMPMGLEDWEMQTRSGRVATSVISEARLQAQLGVDHFRMPPIVEKVDNQPGMVDARYALPVVRFPEWHECPKCHRLGRESDPFAVTADGNRLYCVACGEHAITNPVRFVVACDGGHIEDFPWVFWAHHKRQGGICENPVLFLKSHGKSASLADLYVACSNPGCNGKATLADAFTGQGMKGRKCRGIRPWLYDRVACDKEPRVLQRGASNIQFPAVASALSIPPVSEPIFQMLDEHWSVIRSIPKDALVGALQGMADTYGVAVELLVAAHGRRMMIERGDAGYTEIDSRSEEYLALGEDRDDPAVGGFLPQFQNHVIDPPEEISAWFDLVGAVSRLREVRALAGFSRIEPYPVSGDRIAQAIKDGHIAPLSKTPKNWLPAAEIRGEGVFLRFRTEAVDAWVENNPAVAERAAALNDHAARLADERGYALEYQISPRLLLVHSFAHAMIRQLSIDCGYSSSALRERLYIAEAENGQVAMNGFLIYTGSPDSEGSLGGLVRQALPELIVDAVRRAIHTAQWCGSDPVCLETDPDQSGERISGAACHCCMLLPETACEKFNRELDRSVLVGDSDGRWQGFFAGFSATGE